MQEHMIHLNSIKKFIKNKNVRFLIAKIDDPTEHGFCLVSKDKTLETIIILDPEKEFLATLIHECLHGIYNDYSESRILKIESQIVKKLSSAQFKNLLLHFGKHAKVMNKGTKVKDIM